MAGRPGVAVWFRFRFGQRVRVVSPPAETGAAGRIISGRLYPDGRELYCVDVPGGSWLYLVQQLEDAELRDG